MLSVLMSWSFQETVGSDISYSDCRTCSPKSHRGRGRNWFRGRSNMFPVTQHRPVSSSGLFCSCYSAVCRLRFPRHRNHSITALCAGSVCLLQSFSIYCLCNTNELHSMPFVCSGDTVEKWSDDLTQRIALVLGRIIKCCLLLKPWKLATLLEDA
jgi:hypothetical protein